VFVNHFLDMSQIGGGSGAAADNRKLQNILQKIKINGDSFFICFITKIDAENNRCSVLQDMFQSENLLQQMEPALEPLPGPTGMPLLFA